MLFSISSSYPAVHSQHHQLAFSIIFSWMNGKKLHDKHFYEERKKKGLLELNELYEFFLIKQPSYMWDYCLWFWQSKSH